MRPEGSAGRGLEDGFADIVRAVCKAEMETGRDRGSKRARCKCIHSPGTYEVLSAGACEPSIRAIAVMYGEQNKTDISLTEVSTRNPGSGDVAIWSLVQL